MRFSIRRRLPIRSVLFLVIAAGCGMVAFQALRAELTPTANAAGPVVRVVTVTRQVPPGTTVAPDDLQTTELPQNAMPADALTDPAAAIGMVAPTGLYPGELVVPARLARSAVAPTVGLDRVVVSAPFDAVPAGLGPADRVDVYATFPGARPYTTQVGVALRVIAVTTSAGDVTGGGGGGGTSVLLDVTPDEARSLAQAMASAVLTLAVRGSAPPPSASAAPSAAPTPG